MSRNSFSSRRDGGQSRSGGSGGRRSSGNGRSKSKFIDNSQMQHIGLPIEEVHYVSERTFESMNMNAQLKKNLLDLGYLTPTAIQDQSFETVSEIRDVIGIANTGTGKTGAFLMPIINNLMEDEDVFQTLIILPTRELADQVEQEFHKLAKGMNLYVISLIGGQPVYKDINKLKRFHHVVVGTPGRLCDLVRQKKLNISNFSILVIDEFDRLLDMGFQEDVFFLADEMANRDQTMLFSATIDRKLEKLISLLMNDPIELKVSSGSTTAEHITQEVIECTRDEKFDILLEMLAKPEFEKVLIFSETKMIVSEIAYKLKKEKIKADEIHGDKSQEYRKKALARFKNDNLQVLVATDVAARGLDISDVTHVINYQVPQSYETYIHRIGRTGRAGKPGHAYTFVTNKTNKSGGNRRERRREDSDKDFDMDKSALDKSPSRGHDDRSNPYPERRPRRPRSR